MTATSTSSIRVPAGNGAWPATSAPAASSPAPPRLTPAELGHLAAGIAAEPQRWRELVRYEQPRRWFHRLELTDAYEVWLLSWLPGQGTGFHDHGGSAGAFTVTVGEVQEHTVPAGRQLAIKTMTTGPIRTFGPKFIHHVVNKSAAPAVSVHAYSPPLPDQRRYELTADGLRYCGTEPAEEA